jgi:hypothetical protein
MNFDRPPWLRVMKNTGQDNQLFNAFNIVFN